LNYTKYRFYILFNDIYPCNSTFDVELAKSKRATLTHNSCRSRFVLVLLLIPRSLSSNFWSKRFVLSSSCLSSSFSTSSVVTCCDNWIISWFRGVHEGSSSGPTQSFLDSSVVWSRKRSKMMENKSCRKAALVQI
jgi:hypothetical protein